MKKILALLLALITILSLTACNKNETNGGETRPATPVVTDPSQETTEPMVDNNLKSATFVIADNTDTVESTLIVNQNKPEEAALAFLTAIATNQHEIVPTLLNINDTSFVTASDVAFNIPRGDFGAIADYAGKTCYVLVREEDVSKDGDKATVTATLMDESDKELTSFAFKLVMNAENKWVVENDNFIVSNFNIVVPGKAKVFIDGVELDSKYFVEKTGEEKMYDLYMIEHIGKAAKKIKITGAGFEKEIDHTPTSNTGSPLTIEVKIDGDELTARLDDVKTMWNNMYQDYINGVAESEILTKYFTTNADASSASIVLNHFKEMTKEEKNHVMTDALPHESKDSYFLTENTLLLNLRYKLTFIDGKRESSQRQNGHIWLAIEDGEYKIAKITDENMFNPQWVNQW